VGILRASALDHLGLAEARLIQGELDEAARVGNAAITIIEHMNLTPETQSLIQENLRELLAPVATTGLVGVSCIAEGADSIFARVVLDLGGQSEAILPAESYRLQKVGQSHLHTFDELLDQACEVRVMSFQEPSREAYEAANEELLRRSDEFVAVWDRNSPVDRGGTAAVVQAARSIPLPVRVIWPNGAERRRERARHDARRRRPRCGGRGWSVATSRRIAVDVAES